MNLTHIAEMLFGMKAIENLSGLREQFATGVPNPGRAIAQHRLTPGFGFQPCGAASVVLSICLPPSPPDLGFKCPHTQLVFGHGPPALLARLGKAGLPS
jgi:hypothetical protein